MKIPTQLENDLFSYSVNIIVHTFLVTRKSMVTYPICTLAIHPFIWGGADVAVLLPMDSWYASP